ARRRVAGRRQARARRPPRRRRARARAGRPPRRRAAGRVAAARLPAQVRASGEPGARALAAPRLAPATARPRERARQLAHAKQSSRRGPHSTATLRTRGGRTPRSPRSPPPPGAPWRLPADPATNTLVVSATPADWQTLQGVIADLDVRRRQVFVEAIVLEATTDKLRPLGIGLRGATQAGRMPNGQEVPAFTALLTALENQSDVDVLSAPNMVTTDNEEAEIVVGRNVPFVASRATSSSNLSNLFT